MAPETFRIGKGTQEGLGSDPQQPLVLVENRAGLKWAFAQQSGGFAWGSIFFGDQVLEAPLTQGVLFLRRIATGEVLWLCASSAEHQGDTTALFSGGAEVEGVPFAFQVAVSLSAEIPAARIEIRYAVDRELSGWEVGVAYHAAFVHRTGCKSMSSTSGRALPAVAVIYAITADPKHGAFAEQLERYVREDVEGRCRFTGHHPDLPPDELEGAMAFALTIQAGETHALELVQQMVVGR